MTWNEPGSSNGSNRDNRSEDDNKNDQDPWRRKGDQDTPPELDEVLRNIQRKLSQLVGKKSGDSRDGGKDGSDSGREGSGGIIGVTTLLLILVGLWALSGIFIVQPAERAVVLRFGKYVKTVGPGPHWIPRIIESQKTVNEQKIATYAYDSEMLTKDENIVSVAVAVQYRINNAKDYLYNVVNPQQSLQQATASALRQVIGDTTLDEVLTSGREQVRREVHEQLVQILDRYHAGLFITDVALLPAKAPEAVKEAFDDAIKAQEDEQRYINQAQAYARQVVPIAQGQGKRLLAAAEAYKQQIELKASGETARFLKPLREYQKAPEVTRERMYLDTIQSVLSATTKILMDVNGSNNLVYLPLDKILGQQGKSVTSRQPSGTANTSNSVASNVAQFTLPSTVRYSNNTYLQNSSGSSYQQRYGSRSRDDDRSRGGQ